MARLARMHVIGSRTGRGESGGKLAPDMAGFAHAADDDAALHGGEGCDRCAEGRLQAVLKAGQQGIEALAFRSEGTDRGSDRVGGLSGAGFRFSHVGRVPVCAARCRA